MSVATHTKRKIVQPVDVVGRPSTADERAPLLERFATQGHRGIDEPLYLAAVSLVQRGWHIQGEQYSGARVTWYVIPSWHASDAERRELQDELYGLGNRQPYPAVTCDGYKIVMIATS